MLSKEIWGRHQVPIIATVAGLSVATGLALAPLVGSDAPAPTAMVQSTATVPAMDPAVLDDIQSRLTAVETATRRLSAIETRLDTLEKAVVRGHQRTRALQDQMRAVDGLPSEVSALVAKVQTLDKAVPRLHQRAMDLQELPAEVTSVAARVHVLEAQVMTLDRAVVRTAERLRNVAGQQSSQAMHETLDDLRSALDQLSSSLASSSN